jgi:DNA-binding CsgD family transcriptional regulator
MTEQAESSLDRTVAELYAAALEPARWPAALRDVAQLTGSVGAVVNLVPLFAAAEPLVLAGNFADELSRTYARDHMSSCRRIAHAVANPTLEIVYDAMAISPEEMKRDPVYDWLGSIGLRYYIGGQIGRIGDHHIVWSTQRSPAQGHAQADDLRLFARLLPHFRQALRQAAAFETLNAGRATGTEWLTTLPQPVLLLNSKGQIVAMSAAAERVLRSGDGIGAVGGVVATASTRDRRAFNAAVAGAMRGEAGAWVRITRPSGRLPLAILVSRFGHAASPLFGTCAPRVVAILYDPESRPTLNPAPLRQVYDLTGAEARLAVQLAAGYDLKAAAGRLGIARETARAQLRAVFRKLGVDRQADLAIVLTGLNQQAPTS